jgi:hypothetical protein
MQEERPEPALLEEEVGRSEADEVRDDVSELESIRPQSVYSWKTTSSQRRYIGELERLLLEERKRREDLERKVDLLLERSLAS